MTKNIKKINQNEQATESACACASGGCGCHSHGQIQQHMLEEMESPVRFEIMREGDRVVEFGSGTGNDCLTAARIVGPTGKVVGIDISEKNVKIARDYSDQLQINNVEFRHGDISNVPLPNEYADIVYSNCVFNLQKNKQKVADEMYRITGHDGLACVSDFVTFRSIPDGLRKESGELAGCIAGSDNIEDFINYFTKTGFINVQVIELNKVLLPDEIFEKHLTDEEVENYKSSHSDDGIFSITLIGQKPETCSKETCCCNPDKHN